MPLSKIQDIGNQVVPNLGRRNLIINGAMQVAQRGTSSTGIGASDGYFVCDRWYLDSGATTAGRLTMTQDSSAPSGFANSLKLACTTADTSIASGEQLLIQQRIEGQNLQAFAKGTSSAKAFAVSFYVKGNASATYICELHDQDNDRQCSKTFNVTTDWTRIELIFPADTTGAFDDDNAKSLNFNIALHAGATYTSGTLNSSAFATTNNNNRYVGGSSFFDSTSRTFFITGVQLEPISVTEFEHEPVERTIAKCQRYFRHFQSGDSAYMMFFNGFCYNSTTFIGAYPLTPKMRGQPSLGTTGTASNYEVLFTNNSVACSAVPFLDPQSETDTLDIRASVSSGLTAGSGAQLRARNSASSFLTLDAEL